MTPPTATDCVVPPSRCPIMRRWFPRAVQALFVGIALPAAVAAQPPAPPTTPPPPAATLPPATPTPPATPAPSPGGTIVVVPGGAAVYLDPYHAATPYNPIVVNQNVPNPTWNRPVTTLPCG